jgi:hypothetical protein
MRSWSDNCLSVLLQLEYAARRGFEELPFFQCHALMGPNNCLCSLMATRQRSVVPLITALRIRIPTWVSRRER